LAICGLCLFALTWESTARAGQEEAAAALQIAIELAEQSQLKARCRHARSGLSFGLVAELVENGFAEPV
jgi:hypothetical protein